MQVCCSAIGADPERRAPKLEAAASSRVSGPYRLTIYLLTLVSVLHLVIMSRCGTNINDVQFSGVLFYGCRCNSEIRRLFLSS